jgi:hypothetical protein
MSYPPNLAATWPHRTQVVHQHRDFPTSIATLFFSMTMTARRVPPAGVNHLGTGPIPRSRGPPRLRRIFSIAAIDHHCLSRDIATFASDDSSRLPLRCNGYVGSEVGPLPTFRDHLTHTLFHHF